MLTLHFQQISRIGTDDQSHFEFRMYFPQTKTYTDWVHDRVNSGTGCIIHRDKPFVVTEIPNETTDQPEVMELD